MTSLIAELQQRAPRIRTIGLPYHSSEAALEAVSAGDVQVALFGHRDKPTSSQVTFHAIAETEIMLALPPNSALTSSQRIGDESLVGQPFVITRPGTVLREYYDELAVRVGGLRIAAEISHREAMLPLVAQGVGLSLVSGSWRKLVHATGVSLRGFSQPAGVTIWLATRSRLDVAAQTFVDLALASKTANKWTLSTPEN